MQVMRSGLVKSYLEAKMRADEAAESLKVIMDLPYPGRAQRIHDAAHEWSIARKEMIDAHSRLADFVEKNGLTPVA
jgi:hypothetical protein